MHPGSGFRFAAFGVPEAGDIDGGAVLAEAVNDAVSAVNDFAGGGVIVSGDDPACFGVVGRLVRAMRDAPNDCARAGLSSAM